MAGYSQITSGGQSGLVAGGVIQHTLFTEEFTAIVNAFNATTGHTHDGTAGEGGIITALRSNPLTFGAVDTSDVVITFEGGSGNDGVLTWDQSADKFIFSDTVEIAGNLNVTGTADFGDADFTDVGTIALDSIKGDEDGDTSITFSGSDVITIKTNNATRAVINNTGIDVTGEVKGTTLNIDGAASIAGAVTDVTTLTASGEIEGGSLDINGNAALTGTVTIDPPLVTSAPQGLGAKGVIMKQGDLRMKVDGNYDATNAADVLGGSLQNNSRIIFDSEQHEHIQYEDKGYQKPAFVIQANYDASNTTYGSAGTDAQAYLDANISQLGNGNLNISSGKLQLRGKISTDTSTADGQVAGDGYLEHESYMAITIDGDATNGTVTRLHFGKADAHNKNIRLQPSASGIVVEGMGTAGSPTTTLSNSGTIGTFNDEDLITLAQNQVTVAGELEATTLDINGAASIAGAVTDVTDLTASGTVTTKDLTLFEEDSDSDGTVAGPTLTLQRKTSGANAQANDNLGEIIFKGENSNGSGDDVNYVRLLAGIADSTAGSENSKFMIQALKDGATKNIALFRSGLISFGQRNSAGGDVRNENQPVEFNGPMYGRVGGTDGSRFVHSEQGLNLEGKYTVPIKNSRTIDTISNTSSGTACVVTTDDNHGFSDNMFLYVDNTGIDILDGKSFFIMTVTGQPKQLTLHNAYDGAFPQHSGAASTSGNIGGLGYGLRIHNTQTDSAHEQDCSIELGGNDDVFIDLKKPNKDDYDLRVAHLNNNGGISVVTSKTGNLILKTETNGSSVLLQHEGANTKLQTTDTGIDVTGTVTADGLSLGDDETITLGDNNDLTITHKSSNGNSTIKETGSGNLILQADDLQFEGTSSNKFIKCVSGGAVQIWHNAASHAAAKLTTTATGIDVTGTVSADGVALADDKVAGFGTSEDRGNNWNGVAQGDHFDLEIFHEGSASYIKDYGTGNLAIEAADLALRDNSNNRRVYCTNGAAGSVQLYYGDSSSGSKLDTTDTGIAVTGKVTATVSAIGDNDVAVYGAGVADDDFLRINGTDVEGLSASEVKTALSLAKADVGLGSVDNESKATMFSSPTFTGTVTAPALTASLTVAVESASKNATEMTALIGKRIIHTGTAEAYTMPDVVANDAGKTWTIMNNGTGSLTINRTTNTEFFELVAGQTSAAATSITLVKGGAAEFIVQAANKIVVVGSGI